MTEEIFRFMAAYVGESLTLLSKTGGGISAYPSGARVVRLFLDGNRLIEQSITFTGKGRAPAEIFSALDSAIEAACGCVKQSVGGWEIYGAVRGEPKSVKCGNDGFYTTEAVLTLKCYGKDVVS